MLLTGKYFNGEYTIEIIDSNPSNGDLTAIFSGNGTSIPLIGRSDYTGETGTVTPLWIGGNHLYPSQFLGGSGCAINNGEGGIDMFISIVKDNNLLKVGGTYRPL